MTSTLFPSVCGMWEHVREKMCEVVKVSVGVVQGRDQTDNILGNKHGSTEQSLSKHMHH